MTAETRQERLSADLESLRALRKSSHVFDFDYTGEPPNRYTVTFRGRGISRGTSSRSDVEFVELHRVDLRLPYSYPERPPDIRWLTPIFHPNVSFSGFINLKDIELPWEKDLGLDVICERLWDVARLAYLNLDRATNHSAKNWFKGEHPIQLPVDARPLRNKTAPSGANVIRYERRGGHSVTLPEAARTEDILFIGEDTPTPDLPVRVVPPVRRRPPDDDDVLYIGDD